MKKALAILLFCFSALYLSAQKDTIFQYTYGGIQNDICNQVKATYDGGYIMIGSTNSFGHGATDMYVVKTDSLGRHQWSKAIGGKLSEQGYSVEPTYDHGYALLGWTNSYGNGGYDVFLVKTDSVGDIEWQKTYGGSDWDFGYSIRQTADSGFVICGQTYSYGAGNGDVYVVRTDKNGDTLWTRTIGGTGYDIGNSVCVKHDSIYVIAGATNSFGIGDTDMYFIQIDNKGIIERDTTYGSTHNDVASSVNVTSDGGYVLSGHTDSITPGNEDGYLVKVDSLGKEQWQFILNYSGVDIGKDAVQCPDGSLVYVGTSNSGGLGGYAMYIARFSFNNVFAYWDNGLFEGGTSDEEGNSVAYNPDNGNIALAGATSSYGAGLYDFYLVRYKNDTDIIADNACAHTISQFQDTLVLTGINEQQSVPPAVKVFPSPVTNEATVLVQDEINTQCTFSLYDIMGKCVISKLPVKPAGHRQLMAHFTKGNLSPGEYFYKVKAGSNRITTGKIIVE